MRSGFCIVYPANKDMYEHAAQAHAPRNDQGLLQGDGGVDPKKWNVKNLVKLRTEVYQLNRK
jgi:hypothetical protein